MCEVQPSNSVFYFQGKHLILHLHIQPRASKSEWGGLYGNKIKLRITAAPISGKANKHCIIFLAKALQVPKSNIHILHGETNRSKVVQIDGVNPQHWQKVFEKIHTAH